MEFVIGIVLALCIGGIAAPIGFDRERAFYPVMLIVIASYYVLFAVQDGSSQGVFLESIGALLFTAVALFGFKKIFG